MKITNNKKWIIFGLVFIIAIILRFSFLSQGALLGDEPAYSLRSIGLVDTLGSDLQTTPVDWYDELPGWARLSFHDHPPLTFWLNHIFFSIGGDNILVARLPGVIFGLFSMFIIYLLAKKLFRKESIALLAMAMYAFNGFSVFYSRTSMMESITLFFILLSFWLFIISSENKKYWPLFGLILGLSILAKYTAMFAIPAYLIIVVWKRRDLLKEKYFYFGILLFLFAILPVVIYNLVMHASVGHFDLQLSFLLKQNPQEWQELVGKDVRGGFLDRFFGLSLWANILSIPALVLSIGSLFWYILRFIKKKPMAAKNILLILLATFYLLMPLVVGAFPRFLYYLLPFIVLLSAVFIGKFLQKKWAIILTVVLLIYELFFSFNTNVLNAADKPVGYSPWLYSRALAIPNDGVYTLDNYLDQELVNKKSALKTNLENKTIAKAREKFSQDESDYEYYPAMFFYDHRLKLNIVKWVIIRRSIYHGWLTGPIYDIEKTLPTLAIKGPDTIIYYIYGVDDKLYRLNTEVTNPHPNLIADMLNSAGIEPIVIENQSGEPMFYVFKITAGDMFTALYGQ